MRERRESRRGLRSRWWASLSRTLSGWARVDDDAHSPLNELVDGNTRYANHFLYPNHWHQGCGQDATPLSPTPRSTFWRFSLRSWLPYSCWPLVAFLSALLLVVYVWSLVQRSLYVHSAQFLWE